jgi:hypothetical protein
MKMAFGIVLDENQMDAAGRFWRIAESTPGDPAGTMNVRQLIQLNDFEVFLGGHGIEWFGWMQLFNRCRESRKAWFAREK